MPSRLLYFRQPSGREPVRDFLDDIGNKKELAQVLADLTLLRDEGPILPFPHSSSIVSFPGLRELRTRHGNSQFRVITAWTRGMSSCCMVLRSAPRARHGVSMSSPQSELGD